MIPSPAIPFAVLDELESQHARLEQQLSDPAVLTDHRAVRDLSIRRAALDEVVAGYRDFRRLSREAVDLRTAMADGSDPDFAALARAARVLMPTGEFLLPLRLALRLCDDGRHISPGIMVMNKLCHVIESLRSKIDGLHKYGLKETPTRTIVIDPLLEALGWDVRDPDEVQLEYPTVDGKSVDYGLKLNRKCVLLVEAKAFDDPLTDVKAITQIVNYANSGGIVWCILTNGLTWKVYRSIENCPAPDKLMFEVSIDPRDSEGMSVSQIAQQMWRFSREEIAKGALDTLGEQTFTDGKVRKALDTIMVAAPRSFMNVVRKATGDQTITPQQVKESLSRIWRGSAPDAAIPADGSSGTDKSAGDRANAPKKARRTRRAAKSESPYDEARHIAGKPKEAIELYRAIDRLCLSLGSGSIARRYLAMYIAYDAGKGAFCSVRLQQGGLRVWLRLKYSRLANPPSFARDVSGVGRHGLGDLEMAISSLPQLEQAAPLIRDSFDASGR